MNRKKSAVFICIIFLFVTFASLFYIAGEENHDCTGEDCPVCACVHQAEQTLRNIGTGKIVTPFVGTFIAESGILLALPVLYLCFTSLVNQKVRLND